MASVLSNVAQPVITTTSLAVWSGMSVKRMMTGRSGVMKNSNECPVLADLPNSSTKLASILSPLSPNN